MKNPKFTSLDATVVVLGSGLLLGILARFVEISRPLAQLLGF